MEVVSKVPEVSKPRLFTRRIIWVHWGRERTFVRWTRDRIEEKIARIWGRQYQVSFILQLDAKYCQWGKGSHLEICGKEAARYFEPSFCILQWHEFLARGVRKFNIEINGYCISKRLQYKYISLYTWCWISLCEMAKSPKIGQKPCYAIDSVFRYPESY